MANEIQEKMLEAIDVLINNRLNQLDSNTTITATITGALDTAGTQYICEGDGNIFNAASTADDSFAIGDLVYVLMSKDKNIILGKVTKEEADVDVKASLATQNNYYAVGGNFPTFETYTDSIGLSSYKKADSKIIYEYEGENNLIVFSELELVKFAKYIEEANALMLQATFQTELPVYQTRNTTGAYGLKVVLKFEQDDVQWTKTLYLNSTTMSGNPYQYTSPSKQYMIFNLKEGEGKYFKNIESIEFISGNFVAINNIERIDEENIFCSEIKFTCLEPIEKINNEYYILINTPMGACFNSYGEGIEEDLVVDTTVYFNKTNISALCSYAWFVEDGRIDVDSLNYRSIAGPGWRYIGSENISKTFSAIDNQAEKTNYLCIASYDNEMVIKQTFSLFNIAENMSKIKIISSDGRVNFPFYNSEPPTLVCLINDEANFDNEINYSFVWYLVQDGVYNLIIPDEENIKIENNYLTYPVSGINGNMSFICQVYSNDVFIGQGRIVLTDSIDNTNKNVVINNGNQIFQYAENGMSPCSEIKAEPQEILPLTAQAFGALNTVVPDSEVLSVIWRFPPISSSLIIPPAEAKLSSNDNYYYLNTIINNPVNFSIKSTYNVNATDNQIMVVLNTQNEKYAGYTSFTFTKIGDFNSNGIDLIAKITPKDDVENLILFLNKDISNDNPYTDTSIVSIDTDGDINTPNVSIIDALMLLENVADKKTQCEYLAQYAKTQYEAIQDNNDNRKRIYFSFYYDLTRVVKGQITIDELLFDYLDNYKSTLSKYVWNTGQENPKLKVQLYKSGIEIAPTKVNWSILGSSNRSKFISVTKDNDFTECTVGIKSNLGSIYSSDVNNLIVRAAVTYTDQEGKESICYAVYPINVVIFNNYGDQEYDIERNDFKNNFRIIEKETLRSVMYNRDGRNPIYNVNQGISLEGIDDFIYSYWIAESGPKDSSMNAPMTVEKDNTDLPFCKVIPNNIYTGEYTNTNVHVILYTPAEGSEFDNLTSIYNEYGKKKVDIYIPIHFYLNTNELTSLTSWDGNHLEINEEENYILAPQIGVGKKEENNSFTGLVMGEAKFYDEVENATGELQPTSSIGLLGYKSGRQSIFINAEDGSAIFGLPEQRAAAENRYTEGRIVIQPGGESKIGMWTIGSRALYNINQGTQYVKENGEPTDNNTGYVASVGYNPELLKGSYYANRESGLDYTDFQSNEDMKSYGYAPHYNYFGNAGGWVNSGKNAYDITGASVVIPPEAQGLVLSANPAFISAKTMPLMYTSDSSKVNTIEERNGQRYLLTDIDLESGNSVLQTGDSIEVQINPNSASPFGIFRHTQYKSDGNADIDFPDGLAGQRYRYPLMGINHNGQLFVNSLQNAETNLRIGQIEAFGYQTGTTAENSPYLGHKFVYENENHAESVISKIFINKLLETQNSFSPLYISAGQNQNNEYSRSISLHGKTIELYAANKQNDIDVLTSSRMTIANSNIEFGHLPANEWMAKEREVILTNNTTEGWDTYQDVQHNEFFYWGSIFEKSIKTTYTSNGVTITPSLDYYVNASNSKDIRVENASGLRKITKSLESSFSSFAGLNIEKIFIPVHWNEDGIINSVYTDGTIVNSDNPNYNNYTCYYYNSNGDKLMTALINSGDLLGRNLEDVLTLIIKIVVSSGNLVNYSINQVDLNKEFSFVLTTNQNVSDVYPTNLSEFTLTTTNIDSDVLISGDYLPPQGYSVYTGTNIPVSNLGTYICSQQTIFILDEKAESLNGAFLNNGTLYWLQKVSASFLRNAFESNESTITADIPIVSYTLRTNGTLNTSYPVLDICNNDWKNYSTDITSQMTLKENCNYFSIPRTSNNTNLTNSILNLPSNNFSLKIQKELFEFYVEKNKNITAFTNRGFELNAAKTIDFTSISGSAGATFIRLQNKDSNNNRVSEVNAMKDNATEGSFRMQGWSNGNLRSRILSEPSGQLNIYSYKNTMHTIDKDYYLYTHGTNGILLRSNYSNEKFGTDSVKDASLKLTAKSTKGEFILRGGNNSVIGNSSHLVLSSDKKVTIKCGNDWLSIFKQGDRNIIQTNLELFVGTSTIGWKAFKAGNINCQGTLTSTGNITIGSGSILNTPGIVSGSSNIISTGSIYLRTSSSSSTNKIALNPNGTIISGAITSGAITSGTITTDGSVSIYNGSLAVKNSSGTDNAVIISGYGNITSNGGYLLIKDSNNVQKIKITNDGQIQTSGNILIKNSNNNTVVNATNTGDLTISGNITTQYIRPLNNDNGISIVGQLTTSGNAGFAQNVTVGEKITVVGTGNGTGIFIYKDNGLPAVQAKKTGSVWVYGQLGLVQDDDTTTIRLTASNGNIVANGEVTGKGIKLSSHTHPFSLTGTLHYYRSVGSSPISYYRNDVPFNAEVTVPLNIYRVTCYINGSVVYQEDFYSPYSMSTGRFEVSNGYVIISRYGGSSYTTNVSGTTSVSGTVNSNSITIDEYANFSIGSTTQLSGNTYYGTGSNGTFSLYVNSSSLGAPQNI